MVDIDHAVVCRLRRGNTEFEILVDPESAMEYRKGKKMDLDSILAVPGVYYDVRKGDAIPNEVLQKNFGSTDPYKISEKILLEGELQFTTEQRRALVERKTKEIAEIISKKAINPQTNLPHPPQRILNAMEQAGCRIDPFLDANMQVDRIVKDLKVILPIKFETVKIQITIPPQYTGKVYSDIKKSYQILIDRWLNDGSLQLVIQIPAGIEPEMLEKIASLTKGNFTSKEIERSG